MSDKTPSILITGANGFVGTRLCRKFLTENYEVIAGVRKTADLSQLDGLAIKYRFGDVTQPETLNEMVAGVDYIIHNAGIVKAKKPEQFFYVNEQGTKNLLDAVWQYNPRIKKIIYISSQAAAGPVIDNRPVTENDSPHPITAYGKSKLAGENVVLSYTDRLPVVAIRPPGIYGPGDKEIFSFFQTVNNRIKPYIGDTSRRLQLVHVDDLCRGIFLAVTSNTPSGAVYFIAEKKSYSMKELVLLLESASGKKGMPLYLPASIFKLIALISEGLFKMVNATPMLTLEKAGELLASWEINVSKAKKEIGFESQIDFETGARETFLWYRKKGWLK